MEAVQKDHWYLLVLLIFLPLLKGESVTTTVLQERMVLDCLCPWNGNLSMVVWTKLPKTKLVVFHPDHGTQFFNHYHDRVDFLKRTSLDGSIAISNVSQQDLGLYRCFVHTFPLGSWTRDIEVVIDDTGTRDVEVVIDDADEPDVPPTEAQSDTKLVAERSKSLTISCNHQHNGSIYNVTVEKLGASQSGGGGAGVLAVCWVVDGRLVVEEFTQRGSVNCMDGLNLSLHLPDVAEEDAGVYRCRFHTDAGVRAITMLLTVPSLVESSLSEYMVYIYMVIGVTGFMLLFVLLILVVLYRKKWREEYRVKLHPAHRQRWIRWHRE